VAGNSVAPGKKLQIPLKTKKYKLEVVRKVEELGEQKEIKIRSLLVRNGFRITIDDEKLDAAYIVGPPTVNWTVDNVAKWFLQHEHLRVR
jgi:hypothetical protein